MHDDTSFDPTLVHRLSRRALRPGVTDPGQARTVLTRHGDMTSGLPLAELPSRYVDPVPQHAGSTEPIVYARPASPGSSGPSGTGADEAGPGSPAPTGSAPHAPARHATVAAADPVVSARPAVRPGTDPAGPARTPGGPGTGGSTARSTASPSVTGVTGRPVIQRKVAAPPAPTASAPSRKGSGPPLTPRVPGPLASRGPLATPGSPVAPGPPPADRPGPSAPPKPLARAHGPVMAYRPSAPRREPGAPVESAPATLPTHAGTSAPAVRPAAPHSGPPTPTDVPAVVAHPAPASYPGPPGVESLAARAAAVPVRRPQAQPVRNLPLATATTAPHTRPSPGTEAGRQSAGAPQRPAVQGPAHAVPPGHDGSEGFQGLEGHTLRADRGTSPSPRPEAPQVDVAHITDQVHQRIVRRLAVEAERRGVRR